MKQAIFCFFLALTLFGSAGIQAEEKSLNLFIWSEYIDPTVITDFEKRFHCKVVIDLFEDAEGMMSKLQGGGAELYDVVVPPDYTVPPMRKLGLLRPLRFEKIPNFENIEGQFKSPPFDPHNRFTVPYQWGTVGIFARTNVLAGKPASWSLLFDSNPGTDNFVLIDSMRDLIGAALKYKGFKLNSTEPRELKEVRDLLISAKKRAFALESSVGGKNRVLGKTAQIALVYSGEGARGMSEDSATTYLIPKEGSQIWLDSLAILARAPHPELAEEFLNFVLDGRIGARISNFTQFSTPNAASKPFISKDMLNNPAIYPPPEVLSRCEFLEDLGSKTRTYDEVWTQIKSQ